MLPSVLITGGAGYIGSHTAYYLYKQGYQVIILDNFLHDQYFNPSWAKVIKADFADTEILNKIFAQNNITAVMHFAGLIEVSESVKDPLKYYKNNVEKTITLLETMLSNKVNKFIFSSSCAIFGEPELLPINENHTKKPISPYGKTKLMIEDILQDFSSAYDLSYVCLRYFNAAGALPEQGLGEQHKPETHLIPLLIEATLKNKPFYVFGTDYPTKDGTCIRDFIHVLDIAQAHHLALSHLLEGKPSDSFNLGSEKGFTIKEIITAIEAICKNKINVIYTKKRLGDPAILIADSTKIKNVLNWKPKYSELDYILRSALAFEYKIERNNREHQESLR